MSLTVSVMDIVGSSSDPLLGNHDTWERVLLSEVFEVINGCAFESRLFAKREGMPLIRIRDVGKDRTECRYVGVFDDRYLVRRGDLLVGMDGDFNCARWGGEDALLNQRVCKISPKCDAYSDHFLEQVLPAYLQAINENTSSVTVKHLSSNSVLEIPLPLPPLPEQERIVAKLEEVLARVNNARERLARVPAILKRFRQSVLAAACSGRLTADWREQHPEVEPAKQLLDRVRATRRETLKGAKTDSRRDVDTEPLPDIPDTWTWIFLPELGELNRGKSRHRPRNASHLFGGPYPFIQTGDVAQSSGRITSHSQTYSEAGLAQSRLWPAGTVCITIAANIADSAILTYPACFPDSVVGIIADADLCTAEYVEFFIRTARDDLSQFAPATAQKNINVAILGEVAVPLPPFLEQREIARRTDYLFSLAKTIEERVSKATIRADKLTQSTLARAFRGELVPTEAELARAEGRSYESAAELLEHIRHSRQSQDGARTARTRSRGSG